MEFTESPTATFSSHKRFSTNLQIPVTWEHQLNVHICLHFAPNIAQNRQVLQLKTCMHGNLANWWRLMIFLLNIVGLKHSTCGGHETTMNKNLSTGLKSCQTYNNTSLSINCTHPQRREICETVFKWDLIDNMEKHGTQSWNGNSPRNLLSKWTS
jgi:hypothetical protein